MRTSVEHQRSELHHRPSMQVRIDARVIERPNASPCYEHRRVVELAESTIGGSQTRPLCERQL